MNDSWTALERATTLTDSHGTTRNIAPGEEYWCNALYTVRVRRHAELVHLSYHRRDRQPSRDWRHAQAMKNQLVGPEFEGLELYPAEDRLVDTSNEYHLWVFLDRTVLAGIGFQNGRWVLGPEEAEQYGAVQRRPEVDG